MFLDLEFNNLGEEQNRLKVVDGEVNLLEATQEIPLFFLNGFFTPNIGMKPFMAIHKNKRKTVEIIQNKNFNTSTVEEVAYNLHESILATGKDEVDIVGISYGGISALYYAMFLRPKNIKVRKLITVCSPLQGVDIPGLKWLTKLPLGICRTGSQILKDAYLIEKIKQHAEDIDFSVLHLAHKNDGLASPESAGLKGQKVKVMDYLLPIIGVHQFACLDLRTHRAVLKEFYDQD